MCVFTFRKPDCFSITTNLPVITTNFPVVSVKVGESGYWQGYEHQVSVQELPDDVVDSALHGALLGWHLPAAQLAIKYSVILEGGAE